MKIIESFKGRNESINQMKHLILILNEEMEAIKNLPNEANRSELIIKNGAIINSLEIGISALEKLNQL